MIASWSARLLRENNISLLIVRHISTWAVTRMRKKLESYVPIQVLANLAQVRE